MAAATREALKRKRAKEDVPTVGAKKAAVAPATVAHEYVSPKDYKLADKLNSGVHGKPLVDALC